MQGGGPEVVEMLCERGTSAPDEQPSAARWASVQGKGGPAGGQGAVCVCVQAAVDEQPSSQPGGRLCKLGREVRVL